MQQHGNIVETGFHGLNTGTRVLAHMLCRSGTDDCLADSLYRPAFICDGSKEPVWYRRLQRQEFTLIINTGPLLRIIMCSNK